MYWDVRSIVFLTYFMMHRLTPNNCLHVYSLISKAMLELAQAQGGCAADYDSAGAYILVYTSTY